MSWFDDVLAFHHKYGQTIGLSHARPRDEAMVKFRLGLIDEELYELRLALKNNDTPAIADAIVDLAWVVIGTGIAFGIDLRPVWTEVRRANFQKDTRGEGDRRLRKPEGWKPPDILKALGKGRILTYIAQVRAGMQK